MERVEVGKGAGEEVGLVASGGEPGLCAKGGEFSLGEGSEVSGVVGRGLRGGEVVSKDFFTRARAAQRAQFGCLSTKNLPSSFIRVRPLEAP